MVTKYNNINLWITYCRNMVINYLLKWNIWLTSGTTVFALMSFIYLLVGHI